jgi:REP element-mobilizing transposase RayT
MVWATLARAPSLIEGIDAELARIVTDKCAELGCRAVAVGNAADHVHVLLVLGPMASLASLAHRLKGASSRLLGMHLAQPFAWQPGYYAESVTEVDAVSGKADRAPSQRATGPSGPVSPSGLPAPAFMPGLLRDTFEELLLAVSFWGGSRMKSRPWQAAVSETSS